MRRLIIATAAVGVYWAGMGAPVPDQPVAALATVWTRVLIITVAAVVAMAATAKPGKQQTKREDEL